LAGCVPLKAVQKAAARRCASEIDEASWKMPAPLCVWSRLCAEFQSPWLFKLREGSLGKKIGSRPLSKERDPDEGYD